MCDSIPKVTQVAGTSAQSQSLRWLDRGTRQEACRGGWQAQPQGPAQELKPWVGDPGMHRTAFGAQARQPQLLQAVLQRLEGVPHRRCHLPRVLQCGSGHVCVDKGCPQSGREDAARGNLLDTLLICAHLQGACRSGGTVVFLGLHNMWFGSQVQTKRRPEGRANAQEAMRPQSPRMRCVNKARTVHHGDNARLTRDWAGFATPRRSTPGVAGLAQIRLERCHIQM